MKGRIFKSALYPLLLILFTLVSCVKDEGEIPKGIIEVENTNWIISGKFLGQNVSIPMSFNEDGTATFGPSTANWLQLGNEVIWFTKDNLRFEGRLVSAQQIRGEYFSGESVISTDKFTGVRK